MDKAAFSLWRSFKDKYQSQRYPVSQPAASDDYSLARLIPWLLANTFIISFRLSYRIIVAIGEIWLIFTYLIISVFHLVGRTVLLSPFLIIALWFEATAFLINFFLKLIHQVTNLLSTIGKVTIAVLKLPITLSVFLNSIKHSPSGWQRNSVDFFFGGWFDSWFVSVLRRLSHSPAVFCNKLGNWLRRVRLALLGWGSSQVFRYRYARLHYPVKLSLVGASFCFAFGLFGLFYAEILSDLPNPFSLREIKMASSTRIMDRYGRVLYNVYRQENRTFVALNELPPHLLLATIAIEDANFFSHHGVSLRGIVRAAKANLLDKDDRRIQGGSTITQQLVKNVFLSPEKTIKRKLKEIILALFMEARFSKEEILQMYLNEVAYGGTAYGIEEAAKYYFGKSARFLTLAESALLAGLPTKPSANSPFVDPQVARIRQHIVLNRMVENHFITQEEAEAAKREKLVFVPQAINIQAPHFVMMVRDALIERFGQRKVEEGGLQVYTTLDLSVQRMAEQAVRENIARIGKSYRVGNGAALITSPQTGEVLALVGSVDYFNSEIKGNVNIVTSERQPGSAIKPVNYSYAFESGAWHPGSVVDDSPVVYQIAGSKPYAPVNYDSKFRGRVTIRAALAQSINVPAVKVLNSYGVDKMVEQGRKMGITTWNQPERYGLALTLGAAEVKMLDMATVYGTIANLGVRRDPILIRKVLDARGNVLVDNTANKNFFSGLIGHAYAGDGQELSRIWQKGKRVLSQTTAYWLINILSDNKARLPAFGPYAKLEIPDHTVAVKTGTTNDFRDNWTIGFTPDYLVATWVGNTDNTPMNRNLVSGITGAAPMWNEIMTNLVKDLPDRIWAPPDDMVAVKICATNGLLTCQYCPLTVTEYFISGTEPKQACKFQAPEVCAAKRAQAQAEGKSEEEIKALLVNCIEPSPPSQSQ